MPTQQEREQNAIELWLYTGQEHEINLLFVTQYLDAWWCALDDSGKVNTDERITTALTGDIVGLCIELKVPENNNDYLNGTEIPVIVKEYDWGPFNDDETNYIIAKVHENGRATAKIKLYRKPGENNTNDDFYELDIFKAVDNNSDKNSLKLYVELPEWGRQKIDGNETPVKISGENELPAEQSQYLEVTMPQFLEGRWLYDRYKSYNLPDNFNIYNENSIITNTGHIQALLSDLFPDKAVVDNNNVAFGMKTAIRVKCRYVPAESKAIKVDTYEKDFISDDPCRSNITLRRITNNDDDGYSVFQTKCWEQIEEDFYVNEVIKKTVYYDTTGKEGESEFCFKAYMGAMQRQTTLPENENHYLKIKKPGSLGEQVLAVANIYARSRDTGGRYYLTSTFSSSGYGIPEDIILDRNHVCNVNNAPGQNDFERKHTNYCCGFTWWVAMRVLQSNDMLTGKSYSQLDRFRRDMFCIGHEEGPGKAIPDLGVGTAVDFSKFECQPGDIVQINRIKNKADENAVLNAPIATKTVGWGHSVIFVDWERNAQGTIVGIKYLSTQGANFVGGIAEKIEYFWEYRDSHNSERWNQSETSWRTCRVVIEYSYAARIG